jgi:NAD(P)-dependent dehydrogenase (short-subunit alcohol dehydrogenase family)
MKDKLFFRDKVVIVTGASSGIGREAALALARLQAKVVLAARNGEKLAAVKDEIGRQGGQAMAIRTDVSSFADTQRLAKETVAQWGKIDILIANAGEYIQDVSREIDLRSFERSMALNFMGTLHAVKSVLGEMKRGGKGHIVILNSLDAKKGIIDDGPYVAAKSALDGFGDVLRQELRASGIRVTSIYPARVDTPMMENLTVPWISPKIPPEKVVRAMLRGIKRNRAAVSVPAVYRLLGPLNCLFPRFLDRAYRILKIEGEKTGN